MHGFTTPLLSQTGKFDRFQRVLLLARRHGEIQVFS